MLSSSSSNFTNYAAKAQVTLTNCDREPIHIIGAVQGHGCVFVIDSENIVQHVSANVENFLYYTPEEVIGKPFKTFFETFPGTFENLKQYGIDETFQFKEMLCEARRKDDAIVKYHLYCHINSDGFMIVEVEQMKEDTVDYFTRLSLLFKRFAENQDVYSVLELAAEEIKEVTGYDRVMVYEFDADWNGSVVSEKTEQKDRYLGLRYPATDIPAPARELFRKNRFRIIRDVHDKASPLVPQTKDINLSYCVLRSSSQMHIQYLKNMGVKASLTLSLLVGVEKKLWGMITCHHTAPRDMSFSKRKYVDLVAKVVSLQLEALLQRKDIDDRIKLEGQLSFIKQSLSYVNLDSLPSEILGRLCPNIEQLLKADGIILKFKDQIFKYGRVGISAPKIIKWLTANQAEKAIYFTDNVPGDMSIPCDDGMCCGLMAARLAEPDQLVIAVRNEFIRSVVWGGEPKKPSVTGELHPRVSFEKWKEIKRGKSLPWDRSDFDYAQTVQSVISQFVYRWTAEFLRVEAEKERLQKEKLLRDQEVMKQTAILQNTFISNISHELRTPIHAIVGNSERLGELLNTMPLEVKQCVSTIQSSSEHLLGIISDILDISKLEANKIEIQKSPFDFYQKIETIVTSLNSVAAQKGLYLIGLFDVNLPSIMVSDAVRIGQILLNYLSNAIKFTHHGGITLKVELTGRKENAVELTFSVIDTGVGIEEEKLSKLFERFYQVETGRAKRFEGTGLGLAISRQLANMMGGSVGVTSSVGHGSTFWAKIELGLLEGTKLEPTSFPYARITSANDATSAVIFEDREHVRKFLGWYFGQWGIKATFYDEANLKEDVLTNKMGKLITVIFSRKLVTTPKALTAIAATRSADPSVRIIVIDDISVTENLPANVEIDGMLKEPLCMTHLFTLISGAVQVHQIEHQKVISSPNKSHRLHVLLAEDNKANQNIAQFFLTKLGHTVDIVDNGMLAVKAAQETKYDVILMDVLMPVMDGISATLQIRYFEQQTGEHVPIVSLTASSDSSMLSECREVGMDLFLLKPFKKAELEKVLLKVMELKQNPSVFANLPKPIMVPAMPITHETEVKK